MEEWIEEARKERLVFPLEEEASPKECWRTATETRDAIVAGKLDPVEHIQTMAKLCRAHGARGPVNAVACELYQEVSKKRQFSGEYFRF